MAIYQPTNISPSLWGELGNGVVDATKALTVTWQVNGTSALTAFSITIYRNNEASTQLYTTGKAHRRVSVLRDEFCGGDAAFQLHDSCKRAFGRGRDERWEL